MASTGSPAGLIDTDVLIDALRGAADAIAFLNTMQAGGGICMSIISGMELVAGCRNATELGQLQSFLQQEG